MEDISLQLTNVQRGQLLPVRNEGEDEVALDLHNIDPRRPSDADLDLPAPWIYYRLVNQDRDRVLRIEVDPVRNADNQREIKYWTNTRFNPPRDCLQLDLVWRVTFRNEDGEIETIERQLPMFTGIQRPPKDDADAELEAARRLTMVTKAYTYPVVASLDPHQKDEKLWKKVTDICNTEIFEATSETKDDAGKDNWKKWVIHYGANNQETMQGDLIDQRIQLIHQGDLGWTTGPVVHKQDAVSRDKVLQASDRFGHLFDRPQFGGEDEIAQALDRRSVDTLTRQSIRNAGIGNPYNYLTRIKSEIDHEQGCFSDLRKKMLVKTGMSSKTYEPNMEFNEFLNLYGYGWKRWGMSWIMPQKWAYHVDETVRGALGLVGFDGHSKPYQLNQIAKAEASAQEALEAARTRQQEFLNSIQGMPTADDQTRMEQLAQAVRQREMQLQKLEGARLNIKKELNGPRREWESRVAVMCTLQQQMQQRLERLNALLMKSVADGGWGLEEDGSLLTPQQKDQWHSYLQAMEERLKYQQTAIDCATDVLKAVGIDFNSDQQAASVDTYFDEIKLLLEQANLYHEEVNSALSSLQRGRCEHLQVRGHEFLERLNAERQSLIRLRSSTQAKSADDIDLVIGDLDAQKHQVQLRVGQLYNFLQPASDAS